MGIRPVFGKTPSVFGVSLAKHFSISSLNVFGVFSVFSENTNHSNMAYFHDAWRWVVDDNGAFWGLGAILVDFTKDTKDRFENRVQDMPRAALKNNSLKTNHQRQPKTTKDSKNREFGRSDMRFCNDIA